MTTEETLEAATEAGLDQLHLKRDGDKHYILDLCYPEIERFADIIERKTIERCAVVCEDEVGNTHYDQRMIVACDCAAAIRKLGEQ